jgi:hypothetical protein
MDRSFPIFSDFETEESGKTGKKRKNRQKAENSAKTGKKRKIRPKAEALFAFYLFGYLFY